MSSAISEFDKFIGKSPMDTSSEPIMTLKAVPSLVSKAETDPLKDYYQIGISAHYNSESRVKSNLIFLTDVSGSMGQLATPADSTGAAKEGGSYTNLDIVKHAIKAVSQFADSRDSISIIKFNSEAFLEVPLTPMDEHGKRLVEKKLDSLKHGGTTNIWDSLLMALDNAKNSSISGDTNTFILLLTDGVPNVNPPKGILPSLKAYKDNCGGRLPATICTFGFGYHLESKLLEDIAVESGGMYSFIPDASFCGTAFINNCANIFCSQVRDLIVRVILDQGAELIDDESLNESSHIKTPVGSIIARPFLQSGQAFSFTKLISLPKGKLPSDLVKIEMDYDFVGKRASKTCVETWSSSSDDVWDHEITNWRLKFITVVRCVYQLLNESYPIKFSSANDLIVELVRNLKDWISNRGPAMPGDKLEVVSDLLCDLEGQVSEAINSNEHFNRWGKHYLPSLVRAHELQQANNFKDPGIQHYGGSAFKSIRDTAEDIYVSLPPPKSTAFSTINSSLFASAPAASMTSYHNRSAGCIGGNSRMKLLNGEIILAQNVKKGDVLSNGGIVKCVWKTVVLNGEMPLCMLHNDLIITPYHPIVHNDKWTFPTSLIKPILTRCDSLYSFLVEDLQSKGAYKSSFEASNIECIALCHGVQNDEVATHSFFGTSEVVSNLTLSKGWEVGLVTVHQKHDCDIFVRDEISGLVSMIIIEDLKQSSEKCDDRAAIVTGVEPPSIELSPA